MEYAKCILCGHDAKRKSYSPRYRDDIDRIENSGGFCYDCPNCRRYCLDGTEHHLVTRYANDKQKKRLSEYIKTHQLDDEYLELKCNDIEKILRLS